MSQQHPPQYNAPRQSSTPTNSLSHHFPTNGAFYNSPMTSLVNATASAQQPQQPHQPHQPHQPQRPGILLPPLPPQQNQQSQHKQSQNQPNQPQSTPPQQYYLNNPSHCPGQQSSRLRTNSTIIGDSRFSTDDHHNTCGSPTNSTNNNIASTSTIGSTTNSPSATTIVLSVLNVSTPLSSTVGLSSPRLSLQSSQQPLGSQQYSFQSQQQTLQPSQQQSFLLPQTSSQSQQQMGLLSPLGQSHGPQLGSQQGAESQALMTSPRARLLHRSSVMSTMPRSSFAAITTPFNDNSNNGNDIQNNQNVSSPQNGQNAQKAQNVPSTPSPRNVQTGHYSLYSLPNLPTAEKDITTTSTPLQLMDPSKAHMGSNTSYGSDYSADNLPYNSNIKSSYGDENGSNLKHSYDNDNDDDDIGFPANGTPQLPMMAPPEVPQDSSSWCSSDYYSDSDEDLGVGRNQANINDKNNGKENNRTNGNDHFNPSNNLHPRSTNHNMTRLTISRSGTCSNSGDVAMDDGDGSYANGFSHSQSYSIQIDPTQSIQQQQEQQLMFAQQQVQMLKKEREREKILLKEKRTKTQNNEDEVSNTNQTQNNHHTQAQNPPIIPHRNKIPKMAHIQAQNHFMGQNYGLYQSGSLNNNNNSIKYDIMKSADSNTYDDDNYNVNGLPLARDESSLEGLAKTMSSLQRFQNNFRNNISPSMLFDDGNPDNSTSNTSKKSIDFNDSMSKGAKVSLDKNNTVTNPKNNNINVINPSNNINNISTHKSPSPNPHPSLSAAQHREKELQQLEEAKERMLEEFQSLCVLDVTSSIHASLWKALSKSIYGTEQGYEMIRTSIGEYIMISTDPTIVQFRLHYLQLLKQSDDNSTSVFNRRGKGRSSEDLAEMEDDTGVMYPEDAKEFFGTKKKVIKVPKDDAFRPKRPILLAKQRDPKAILSTSPMNNTDSAFNQKKRKGTRYDFNIGRDEGAGGNLLQQAQKSSTASYNNNGTRNSTTSYNNSFKHHNDNVDPNAPSSLLPSGQGADDTIVEKGIKNGPKPSKNGTLCIEIGTDNREKPRKSVYPDQKPDSHYYYDQHPLTPPNDQERRERAKKLEEKQQLEQQQQQRQKVPQLATKSPFLSVYTPEIDIGSLQFKPPSCEAVLVDTNTLTNTTLKQISLPPLSYSDNTDPSDSPDQLLISKAKKGSGDVNEVLASLQRATVPNFRSISLAPIRRAVDHFNTLQLPLYSTHINPAQLTDISAVLGALFRAQPVSAFPDEICNPITILKVILIAVTELYQISSIEIYSLTPKQKAMLRSHWAYHDETVSYNLPLVGDGNPNNNPSNKTNNNTTQTNNKDNKDSSGLVDAETNPYQIIKKANFDLNVLADAQSAEFYTVLPKPESFYTPQRPSGLAMGRGSVSFSSNANPQHQNTPQSDPTHPNLYKKSPSTPSSAPSITRSKQFVMENNLLLSPFECFFSVDTQLPTPIYTTGYNRSRVLFNRLKSLQLPRVLVNFIKNYTKMAVGADGALKSTRNDEDNRNITPDGKPIAVQIYNCFNTPALLSHVDTYITPYHQFLFTRWTESIISFVLQYGEQKHRQQAEAEWALRNPKLAKKALKKASTVTNNAITTQNMVDHQGQLVNNNSGNTNNTNNNDNNTNNLSSTSTTNTINNGLTPINNTSNSRSMMGNEPEYSYLTNAKQFEPSTTRTERPIQGLDRLNQGLNPAGHGVMRPRRPERPERKSVSVFTQHSELAELYKYNNGNGIGSKPQSDINGGESDTISNSTNNTNNTDRSSTALTTPITAMARTPTDDSFASLAGIGCSSSIENGGIINNNTTPFGNNTSNPKSSSVRTPLFTPTSLHTLSLDKSAFTLTSPKNLQLQLPTLSSCSTPTSPFAHPDDESLAPLKQTNNHEDLSATKLDALGGFSGLSGFGEELGTPRIAPIGIDLSTPRSVDSDLSASRGSAFGGTAPRRRPAGTGGMGFLEKSSQPTSVPITINNYTPDSVAAAGGIEGTGYGARNQKARSRSRQRAHVGKQTAQLIDKLTVNHSRDVFSGFSATLYTVDTFDEEFGHDRYLDIDQRFSERGDNHPQNDRNGAMGPNNSSRHDLTPVPPSRRNLTINNNVNTDRGLEDSLTPLAMINYNEAGSLSTQAFPLVGDFSEGGVSTMQPLQLYNESNNNNNASYGYGGPLSPSSGTSSINHNNNYLSTNPLSSISSLPPSATQYKSNNLVPPCQIEIEIPDLSTYIPPQIIEKIHSAQYITEPHQLLNPVADTSKMVNFITTTAQTAMCEQYVVHNHYNRHFLTLKQQQQQQQQQQYSIDTDNTKTSITTTATTTTTTMATMSHGLGTKVSPQTNNTTFSPNPSSINTIDPFAELNHAPIRLVIMHESDLTSPHAPYLFHPIHESRNNLIFLPLLQLDQINPLQQESVIKSYDTVINEVRSRAGLPSVSEVNRIKEQKTQMWGNQPLMGDDDDESSYYYPTTNAPKMSRDNSISTSGTAGKRSISTVTRSSHKNDLKNDLKDTNENDGDFLNNSTAILNDPFAPKITLNDTSSSTSTLTTSCSQLTVPSKISPSGTGSLSTSSSTSLSQNGQKQRPARPSIRENTRFSIIENDSFSINPVIGRISSPHLINNHLNYNGGAFPSPPPGAFSTTPLPELKPSQNNAFVQAYLRGPANVPMGTNGVGYNSSTIYRNNINHILSTFSNKRIKKKQVLVPVPGIYEMLIIALTCYLNALTYQDEGY